MKQRNARRRKEKGERRGRERFLFANREATKEILRGI
jgi:hypothetical protein